MNDVIHQAGTAQPPSLLRRIVAFPLSLLIIGGVITIFAAGLGSQVLSYLPRNNPVDPLAALAIAALIVMTYKGYKRLVERAADTELAFGRALPELGTGLLGGFALFSLMTGIVALLGGIEITGVRWQGTAIWSMLTMAILSGTFEETLFRGLVQRQMEAMIGTWGALAFTSGFFGLLHLGNPGATLWSSLAIAFEAGILLGAAYLFTRRLWLAIGIHAGWNFTQGWVFSVPVSGGKVPVGLLATQRIGPEWLTGGDFGLEASAVAAVVASLAGLALLTLALKRNGVVRPMWRR